MSATAKELFRSLFANHARINPGIASKVGAKRRKPVKSVRGETREIRTKYTVNAKMDRKTHTADRIFFIWRFPLPSRLWSHFVSINRGITKGIDYSAEYILSAFRRFIIR